MCDQDTCCIANIKLSFLLGCKVFDWYKKIEKNAKQIGANSKY